MKPTTEDRPDNTAESAVDQAKRDYERHVGFARQDLGTALDPENPTPDASRASALAYATLAHAAAGRLQAERLAQLTAAVTAAGRAVVSLAPAVGPLLTALQGIAERLADTPEGDRVPPSTAAGAPPFTCRSRIIHSNGRPYRCDRARPHSGDLGDEHAVGKTISLRWHNDDPRVVSPERPESPQEAPEAPEAPDPQSSVDGAGSPASGQLGGPDGLSAGGGTWRSELDEPFHGAPECRRPGCMVDHEGGPGCEWPGEML